MYKKYTSDVHVTYLNQPKHAAYNNLARIKQNITQSGDTKVHSFRVVQPPNRCRFYFLFFLIPFLIENVFSFSFYLLF
jgi:hypothetical protein